MNLPAESALVLRQRSSWEAADSGILLWREAFVYFIPLFALPIWVAAFGLRVLPFSLRPWSYLLIWWLKPFFDRIVLHIIAVRFFEPRSGFRRIFQGLGGVLARGLAGDLLWRRFSPWRSSRMPIRILEKLRGQSLRQRKRVLERGGLDFCFLITALGLLLEGLLLTGELIFAWMMISMFRPDLSFSFWGFIARFEIFIYAAYCFNFMLIESLYVCMGFGLYINGRVEVEGWDIQLLFRNFAGGKAARAISVSAVGPVLLCLILLLPVGVNAQDAAAQDTGAKEAATQEPAVKKVGAQGEGSFAAGRAAGRAAGTEAPLEDLEQILASDDFGGEEETWGIRFKQGDEEDQLAALPDEFPPWMEKIRLVFAYILRLTLILVLGAAAAFSLYRFFKYGQGVSDRGDVRSRGLAASSPEEPGKLFDRAGELYRQGRLREAWAACLAGTIAAAGRRRGLKFPPDATEYGCLALVRSSGAEDGFINGFETLIRRWVSLAYAGKESGPGDFEESLNFGRSILSVPAAKEGARE